MWRYVGVLPRFLTEGVEEVRRMEVVGGRLGNADVVLGVILWEVVVARRWDVGRSRRSELGAGGPRLVGRSV